MTQTDSPTQMTTASATRRFAINKPIAGAEPVDSGRSTRTGRTRKVVPQHRLEAVGLLVLDVDGPLLPIDQGVAEMFCSFVGERFATRADALAAYHEWNADHLAKAEAAVAANPTAHREQIFVDLLVAASRPGKPLAGLSSAHLARAATDLFYPGFTEKVKALGLETWERTNGQGCLVVALNSCGSGPILRAALAALRNDPELTEKPGVHLLLNANRGMPGNNPLLPLGRLVHPEVKGEWLANVYGALVNKFGMPKKNVGSWGDGATDKHMFLRSILAGGKAFITEIGKPGRVELTWKAVEQGLMDVFADAEGGYVQRLMAESCHVVQGNDWEQGTFDWSTPTDTIAESFCRSGREMITEWLATRSLDQSHQLTPLGTHVQGGPQSLELAG